MKIEKHLPTPFAKFGLQANNSSNGNLKIKKKTEKIDPRPYAHLSVPYVSIELRTSISQSHFTTYTEQDNFLFKNCFNEYKVL